MKNRGVIIGLIGLLLISISIVSLSLGGHGAAKAKASNECSSCSLTKSKLTATGVPIPNCLEMVQIELGQSVQFVKSNGDELDGEWEADFGTIEEDGTYIAPQNIAAPGIDRLRFTGTADPNAPEFTIFVQLIASDDDPAEGSQVLDLDDDLDGASFTQQEAEAEEEEESEVQVDVDSASDVMVTPTSTVSMSTVTINSSTAYVVPIANVGGSVTVAMLPTAGSVTGQVGRKCGVFPAPTGGCSPNGAQKRVEGPKKFEKKPWVHKSKTFVVSANIAGSVGLSVGTTVTVDYDVRQVIRYWYIDFYSCTSGSWVYTGTLICRSYGLEYRNFDPAYGRYFVFPPSGNITINFEPPICEDYVK